MDEKNTISETLAGYTPKLSQTEKDALWDKINTQTQNSTPTLSPYLFIFNQKKHMAPIALALMLMLGTTGIVAAAETARPGDTLFTIEQKIEGLRLALASDDAKTRLEAQFAAERLLELSSILDESIKKDARVISASSTVLFEAEADVFTDITIVEVEINNRKTIFETTARTRDEVVVEIMNRFGVARAQVEASLDFENENRSSRDDDKANLTLSSKNEVRVNEAVAVALSYVLNGNFDDDTRDELFTELSVLLDGVPVKMDSQKMRIKDSNAWVEIRNDDDEDDDRLEIRDGDNRVRIREKDGEIRIDTREDNDDDFEEDDDRDDDRDGKDDDDRDDDREERDEDNEDTRSDLRVELNTELNLNLGSDDKEDDRDDRDERDEDRDEDTDDDRDEKDDDDRDDDREDRD